MKNDNLKKYYLKSGHTKRHHTKRYHTKSHHSKNLILKYSLYILLTLSTVSLFPLTSKSQTIIVGFYNCENLYDTIDQRNVIDEEFTPQSHKEYNRIKFQNKITHLASVIEGMGQLEAAKGIALLGVAEIENKMVLQQLVESTLLKKYHLKYIQFDSKDARGVDVALLYNPSFFTPYQYRPYTLTDSSHFSDYATRDILYVQGLLDKTWVHILVNHWPSRRGGEKQSANKRQWAATVCKKIMDSIEAQDPLAKIIVMGDFNDNPDNKSVQQLHLQNPYFDLFKKGVGSLAYRDVWNLFDQILLNNAWEHMIPGKRIQKGIHNRMGEQLKNEAEYRSVKALFDLTYYKSIIYNNWGLLEQEGRYKGYPKRTWNGDRFNNGFSDHFPAVTIFKVKSVEIAVK